MILSSHALIYNLHPLHTNDTISKKSVYLCKSLLLYMQMWVSTRIESNFDLVKTKCVQNDTNCELSMKARSVNAAYACVCFALHTVALHHPL